MNDLRPADISARLAERIDALAPHLFPAGRRVGDEFEVGDINGAPGRSLKVRLTGERAGRWCDFAAPDYSGDALDLVRIAHGHPNTTEGQAKSIQDALEWLGDSVERHDNQRRRGRTNGQDQASEWTPITPIPETAGKAPSEHRDYGEPTKRWAYRNADGAVIGDWSRPQPA